MIFVSRLLFALRHGTLKPAVVDPRDDKAVLVCHRGRIKRLARRCPHRGAPLETGHIEGDALVCPWHGRRFELNSEI